MNPFDLFVCVVGVFFVIRGYFKGIILEVSSIVGVIGGFYGAYFYYPMLVSASSAWLVERPELSAMLPEWVSGSSFLGIASFMLIFFGILLLVGLLGRLIRYVMKITFLGWMDRLFGVIFGLIKGFLFATAILVALTTVLPAGSPIVNNSRLAPHLTGASELMVSMIPEDLKEGFIQNIKEVKKVWESRKKSGITPN